MYQLLALLTIAIATLETSACADPLIADDDITFFESRIRPLLLERCQECHGEEKQEGGLRLDSRAAWQSGGEHGTAIQIGLPETSRLIEAVRYGNTELQMPPAKKLSDQEIADLETWIKSGATDPRDNVPSKTKPEKKPLWSLQPIADVQPPQLAEDNWSQQPIDCFILEKILSSGLQPSSSADRRTLIRRATMDLIGLPPEPDDVDAFLQDQAPDAYERLIERLLASPQYGENWARHWLDVARYSDTKGYVYGREENRWVHASAYRDWVARSLNEDLAYDRFVKLQIAADQLCPADSPDLAAMGFLTLGRRFLGVTHDVIDDRIDVVSRGMLGLSVACARCHDHKYDPIPTRDYYSLYGVFQSSAEKLVSCGQSQDAPFVEELQKREAKRSSMFEQRREEQANRVRSKIDQYLLAQLELDKYPDEVFNQIVEAGDLNPFVVRKWQSYLTKDAKTPKPIFEKWHIAVNAAISREDLNQVANEVSSRFGEIEKQWRDLIAMEPAATKLPELHDEQQRQVLYGMDSPCTVPDEHITNIEVYFPTDVIVELWKLQGEVDRWLLTSEKSPAYATILVDRATPSNPRVFLRGNPITKGADVSRHLLTALGGNDAEPFMKGSGRLELAEAIASPKNPLTARVFVNRVWMHHFGRGLVETPSDFGNRAELPSHPELLDWLAKEFIESGWSIKSLHRIIMLSSTYQQTHGTASQTLDPRNRLLARMTARRLSFEQARDAWLQSASELELRVGGKSSGLFDEKNKRRTLYATIDREKVSPVLRMFDFANPDLSIPQRNETSVPQQALFAMNHPFIAERATRLVASLQNGTDSQRITTLYQKLYQRPPSTEELQLASEFIQSDPTFAESIKRPVVPSLWTYGYGEFEPTTGRIAMFHPLPHFSGDAWQGGVNFPDPKLGWLKLDAKGGHPGNDFKHAIVRRWTATDEGDFSVHSKITHEPEVGDGVRAFVSHSRNGLLRSVTLHHSSEQIDIESIAIQKGESLDFVVDIREGLNSDQFLWSPKIIKNATAGAVTDNAKTVSDAERDFPGESDSPLDRWQQLAQVLMLANEFMFVD